MDLGRIQKIWFKITCLRLSDLSLNRKQLSRKKEKSVKREEKQNMLVHTLMIKPAKRSIFSKDVHIRLRNS